MSAVAQAPLASRLVDRATAAAGLLLAALVVVAGHGQLPPWWAWSAVVAVGLACRWPLMIPTGSADSLLVGLETCLFLLLALLLPLASAMLLYVVGVVLAELMSSHMRDTQLFNTGVRLMAAGAALVPLAGLHAPGPGALARVLAAAGLYFAVDYTWSAVSIAAAEGKRVGELVQLRPFVTGLLAFGLLDTTAYLAWRVFELGAVAALLVVPFGALLVASSSWSTMHRTKELAAAVSAAGVALHAAQDQHDVERLLREHAALVGRSTAADLRPAALADDAVVLPFAPAGVPPRVLCVATRHSQEAYTPADLQALQLLTGVAEQAHERLGLMARLRHSADHDPLTGLVNRRRFEQLLDEALLTGASTGLLYCDLDGFKQVNDTAGHAAGDAVLLAVAARLSTAVRPQDVCARLGGDEFAVLLRDLPDDPDEARRAGDAVAERVRAALDRPLDDGPSCRGASVGLAVGAGGSTDALVRSADAAMYAQKSSRRALR